MTTETTPAAAPASQPAESAPATPPGAETPDGLQEQAGASQEATEATPKEPEQPAQPKGVQKRLDELTRQRGEAQRINERLLGLLEATLQGKPPTSADLPAGPPKREQFETYEAYIDARAEWKAAEAFKQLQQKAEGARQQEAVRQRESTWQRRVSKAAAEIEDFESVVMSDALAISPVMAEAMKDSEIGPQIAYHLGKNPSEALRISQLSPAAQAREIGKIEAQLENKAAEPAKKPSKAPPPIEPVNGRSGTATPDLASMTQAQYEAQRKKDGAWWAR